MSEIIGSLKIQRDREMTGISIKVAELIVKVLGGKFCFSENRLPPPPKSVHVNCEVDDRTLVSGDGGGGSLKHEVTSFISKLNRHFMIRKKYGSC